MLLYYIDTADEFQQGKTVRFAEEVEAHEHSGHEHGTVLEMETSIMENKSKISKQDVHKVELARELQQANGHLSEKQLIEIAQRNQLKNSPITPRDVRLMRDILGPSTMDLKGEMMRKQIDGVHPNRVPVLKHVQDHYQEILAIDLMHVNQIPFLITTSQHSHYHTVSVLPSMNGDIIVFCASSDVQVLSETRFLID